MKLASENFIKRYNKNKVNFITIDGITALEKCLCKTFTKRLKKI